MPSFPRGVNQEHGDEQRSCSGIIALRCGAGGWIPAMDTASKCPKCDRPRPLVLETAAGSMLKRLKSSIDAGLQPILTAAEQFQIGVLNNFAKLFSDRYIATLRCQLRFLGSRACGWVRKTRGKGRFHNALSAQGPISHEKMQQCVRMDTASDLS